MKDKREYKLKSFFYLVRSLLSCNWIVHDQSVLPMHIEGLMQHTDEKMKNRLRELIQLKAGVGEKYLHNKDIQMNGWIEGLFKRLEVSKQSLGVNKMDMLLLNEFFLKMVYAKIDN